MAIDNNSLCYLFDSIFQVENVAGRPVVGGHIEVFVAGTDQKYITWQNFDGTKNPFKIPLNNDGRAVVLVEPHYTYDIYIYDSFNNMICSRLNVKPAIGGDVTVYGLTEVWHDGTMSGEGTPQSPLSVVSAGKVYTGIEPIVVNNIENKISAQHIPLGVQDPLYFVEDSETACILGFSGTVPVPEGTMNESAFGYQDGQITSYNGSAFSAGLNYEAGSNIDITDNVISGKDWSNEINDASAAATAWTDSQGYLTGVDLSEYAKESFVISAIDSSTSGLLPTSAFATASGSFITALPDDLATTGFVADVSADITAMIPTALTGDYLTKDSADTLYQPIGQYQSALDFGYVGSEISSINGSGIYSQGGTANPQIPVTSTSGISIFESGDKVYFNISADYAFNSDLQSVSAEITGMIPSTAGLATEDWVTGQGYLTAETDWTNTITAASANAYEQATAAIPTGLATTGDLASVSADITAQIPTDLFTKASADTLYQPIGDYLTTGDSAEFMTTAERSDYIPTGVSSEFYTTANTANYISEIPDTYLQNTDLGITDNKITAISGVELSAGGDVPEGVMVESGIEYNSQGYINGYSGSAIATIDQERQWFTHDDTLCHVSNSAQYALGVNMSAISADLARMMGVDETVLFESDGTQAITEFTASEPLSSFNKVEFTFKVNNDDVPKSLVIPMIDRNVQSPLYLNFVSHYNGWKNTLVWQFQYNTTGTSAFNAVSGAYHSRNDAGNIAGGDWSTPLRIYKVVGIGRRN